MNNLVKVVKVSDLSELTRAINREHGLASQAFKTALHHAIKAGNLLIEAKAKVEHGAWLPWLQENCEVSERTAQAYMRLAWEVPNLDSAKAQRVANLPLRTALKEIAQERREPEDEELNPDEWRHIIEQANAEFFPHHPLYQIDLDSEWLWVRLDDGSMTKREQIAATLMMNYSKHLCFWANYRRARGEERTPAPIRKYLDMLRVEETPPLCGECHQEFWEAYYHEYQGEAALNDGDVKVLVATGALLGDLKVGVLENAARERERVYEGR